MQSTSTSAASLLNYHNPHYHHISTQNPKLKRRSPTILHIQNHKTHNLKTLASSLTTPSNNLNQQPNSKTPHFHQLDPSLHSTHSPEQYPHRQIPLNPPEPQPDPSPLPEPHSGVSSNMWWADIRAALGQRINFEGIVSSVSVIFKDRHLALPHVSVRDVRSIDWEELRRRGFKGVVFDKDNTITAPYSLKLWGTVTGSMERCKAVFGQDIAVFSNSAGLSEYDHDGSKARALEKAIDIKVIRHRLKKPAGTAEEIEKHFGCSASQLIMVGDRPFTDVVFGNRNGFLTILTEPLTVAEEPFIVRQVRKLETAFVNFCSGIGLKPTRHSLLTDARNCITDPPPS